MKQVAFAAVACVCLAGAVITGGCNDVPPDPEGLAKDKPVQADMTSPAPSMAPQHRPNHSPEEQAALMDGLRKRLSDTQIHAAYAALMHCGDDADKVAEQKFPLPTDHEPSQSEIEENVRKQSDYTDPIREKEFDAVDARYKMSKDESDALASAGSHAHWPTDAKPVKHRPSIKSIAEGSSSIVKMMHASRENIESILGASSETNDDLTDHKGVICKYEHGGNKYSVEYEDDKATSVDIDFASNYDSPAEALAAAGINMHGLKPTESSSLNRIWRGELSESGIRYLVVTIDANTMHGWNGIEITDSIDS